MKLVLQFSAPVVEQPVAETCCWEFKLLRDIELIGDGRYNQARLIYEDDADGAFRAIHCSGCVFRDLEPYAADLLAWKRDPLSYEQPLIPIAHSESEHPRFCPEAVTRARTGSADQIRLTAEVNPITLAPVDLLA